MKKYSAVFILWTVIHAYAKNVGISTLAHLSHMSKIKRQKDPNTMGPTCFQYTDKRFLSVWSLIEKNNKILYNV